MASTVTDAASEHAIIIWEIHVILFSIDIRVIPNACRHVVLRDASSMCRYSVENEMNFKVMRLFQNYAASMFLIICSIFLVSTKKRWHSYLAFVLV